LLSAQFDLNFTAVLEVKQGDLGLAHHQVVIALNKA
jgi:hypothetical protein